jgi:heme a synthase
VLIVGYTLWLLFGLGADAQRSQAEPRSRLAAWIAACVLAFIFLQLLAGALVAGLDAGLGFNTWPLMNGAFVPSGLGAISPWYLNLFENLLTVQFDHRMLGYSVVVATLAQVLWLAASGRHPSLVPSALAVACFALLQATIGVWTLLLAVPIELGLAHQAGAVAVFGASVHHLWLATRSPALVSKRQAAASA